MITVEAIKNGGRSLPPRSSYGKRFLDLFLAKGQCWTSMSWPKCPEILSLVQQFDINYFERINTM